MKKVRYLSIGIVGIILSFIVLAFVNSLGSTYIESSNSSYEIRGMKEKNDASKFNKIIDSYVKSHDVAAIKVFNVLPKTGSNDVETKMYVYGKGVTLPKNIRATKTEFETSDIRYPIYFIGNTDSKSIEKMFKKAGIKYEKIHDSWNTDIKVFITSDGISSLIILVLIVLFIILVLSNLRLLKKINIRFLFGMSRFTDAFRSWIVDQTVFTVSYLLGLLLISIYLKFKGLVNSYKIMAYFAFILYVIATVVIVLAAVIRAISHSRFSIINAIKGNLQSKLSFYVNLIIKVVVEIFICISVVGLLGTLKKQEDLKTQLTTWTEHKTLYTITASPISTSTAEEDYLNKQSMLFFNYLDKHNGILIDYQGWGNGSDVFDSINGNVMTVNAEYLKQNVVKDSAGKRIELPKYSKTTYILIPEKFYPERHRIIKSYREALALDDSEKVLKEKLQTKSIEIANNQKLFTYSSDALSLGYYSGSTNSAALVVLSNNSLGGLNSKLDSNINWSAYMSDAAFLTSDLKLLKRGISKYNLTKYVGSIVNTKSYASKQLSEVNNELLLSSIVIGVAIMIAIVENVAFNIIYFNNNKKKIAIQRLMGQSFFKRFRNIIGLILGLSFIESGLVYLITNNLFVASGLFIFTNICEIILLLIQSSKSDKTIAQVIKGE